MRSLGIPSKPLINAQKFGKYVYAHSFFKSASYHEHVSHCWTITMGLDEPQPGNTLRAKATAEAAFTKFLKGGKVDKEYVRKCIQADESGKAFVCVTDKFGMHLAFSEGRKCKILARNRAMQYYRGAKIWLLDHFPQLRAPLESCLLKMEKTLDNLCIKRDGGGFVSKAAPCMKANLRNMLAYLYTSACSESDYQMLLSSASCAGSTTRLPRFSADTNPRLRLSFNTCPASTAKHRNQTLESIEGAQRKRFATCYQLNIECFNFSKKVIDELTACDLRYYPLLKKLNPERPAIKRVESCVTRGG
ncbi:unnamed protein product [Phytophthora fragariaefolia]|uniref:Unnamed protein product n=1 Tax=Phytophthora fragariaefolia TaxID=1490495 RepID=A0A9W6TW32_9STRA|nr:unnamed protein product [Phytophthora fragariaefolia]